MKTLAAIKRRMLPGARLLCVENTCRPVLDGTYRTIVKSGRRSWTFKFEGDPRLSSGFWPEASEVKILDADMFRFGFEMDGQSHSVTLRFVAEGDVPVGTPCLSRPAPATLAVAFVAPVAAREAIFDKHMAELVAERWRIERVRGAEYLFAMTLPSRRGKPVKRQGVFAIVDDDGLGVLNRVTYRAIIAEAQARGIDPNNLHVYARIAIFGSPNVNLYQPGAER